MNTFFRIFITIYLLNAINSSLMSSYNLTYNPFIKAFSYRFN